MKVSRIEISDDRLPPPMPELTYQEAHHKLSAIQTMYDATDPLRADIGRILIQMEHDPRIDCVDICCWHIARMRWKPDAEQRQEILALFQEMP